MGKEGGGRDADGSFKRSFRDCTRVQIELASIQETVSNPAIGRMRLQFWRDAVRDLSNVSSLLRSSPFPLSARRSFDIYRL